MTLETIQPLIDWLAAHPDLSGLIIFLIACSESLALVGIVVPGVVFMLSIGTLVGLGAINLWSALVWAALGAIAGDWFSYWLGRHFDQQLRHIWPLSRYPKLIPAGERFFKRHGGKSVMFGRFVGPLRPIIPAIAGIMHMSQPKFYLMNFMSAVLWAPVVILPGVAFGSSLQVAQDVFGKLIALVVILILLGALAGFIAKHVLSYALMTTVNTWGEFFGFDRAKENLASFSLVGVLIVSVGLFVYQYQARHQAVMIEQQANSVGWWEENWQDFSPINALEKKFRSDFPITIQWWGSYANIRTQLEERQWIPAQQLTLHNSLHYFLASPDPLKLPARRIKLFGSYEKLIMVKAMGNDSQLSILRIWPVSKRHLISEEQLWVGVIYNVDLISPLNLFHFALRDRNYSDSIKQFKADLALNANVTIQEKYYSNVSRSDNWRGEVLLLTSKNTPVNRLPETEGAKLQRHNLKGTGISLLSPGTLDGSSNSGFSYDNNGVIVQLRRELLGKRMAENSSAHYEEIRNRVRSQLQNAQNLELVFLDEDPFVKSDLRGTQFTATYDMPPFGKQLTYMVKVMDRTSDIWIATGIVKQCDTKGRQLVSEMLNSIAWRR